MRARPHARNFDRQASSYDRRAGLPPEARNAVAVELVRIASIHPTDLLVEIGAGTGQIGRALCAMPIRYLGLDLSRAMLTQFASWGRHDGCATPLAVADASSRWPLRDGSATAIFGSRSLHLLPLPHVMDEARRVAAPVRACVMVGWIARDSDDLRAIIRREMHAILARRGYVPNDAPSHARQLVDAFVAVGARPLSPSTVAAWRVRRSAREVIEGWREVGGLAGRDVPSAEKEEVLRDLAAWGERKFGSLDIGQTIEEKYMLAGVEVGRRALGGMAP
jgi:hypothetical protein